jgi:GTP:adenosylcobinamide-phosphate guanylyltransferase
LSVSLGTFQALVLAGSRPGAADPVADYAGVSHKGLIVLDGETLLARVLRALDQAGATRIGVSTSDIAIVDAVAGVKKANPLPAAGGPSQSVHDGASIMGTPLLVTTVDHALLQPEWITEFIADAPADADFAVLMAPEAVVRAAAPETQRTYWRFKDGGYSGCNMFLLKNERALNAVAFWRKAESFRKQPWRIAAMLGPVMLIRYALGLMTLDETLERLGRAAGVKAAVVRSSYGLAAVDVDKPADLDLVRSLVER